MLSTRSCLWTLLRDRHHVSLGRYAHCDHPLSTDRPKVNVIETFKDYTSQNECGAMVHRSGSYHTRQQHGTRPLAHAAPTTRCSCRVGIKKRTSQTHGRRETSAANKKRHAEYNKNVDRWIDSLGSEEGGRGFEREDPWEHTLPRSLLTAPGDTAWARTCAACGCGVPRSRVRIPCDTG